MASSWRFLRWDRKENAVSAIRFLGREGRHRKLPRIDALMVRCARCVALNRGAISFPLIRWCLYRIAHLEQLRDPALNNAAPSRSLCMAAGIFVLLLIAVSVYMFYPVFPAVTRSLERTEVFVCMVC